MESEKFYTEQSNRLCEPFVKVFNNDFSHLSEHTKIEIGLYALANLTAIIAVHFKESNRPDLLKSFFDLINEKIDLAEKNVPVLMAHRAIEKAMKK
jgi:hypothetical protein